MQRTKESHRHNAFLYQGGHILLGSTLGATYALVFKSPNRFLEKFRESNRRRAASRRNSLTLPGSRFVA
jgi:hypothetical protein